MLHPLGLLLPWLAPWLGCCRWYSSLCLTGLAFEPHSMQRWSSKYAVKCACRLFMRQRFIFHLMPLPNVIQYFLVGWLACLECLCAIFCGVLIATVVKRFPLRRSSIFRYLQRKGEGYDSRRRMVMILGIMDVGELEAVDS